LLNLVPGFFSTDVADGVRSLESLLRLCSVQAPSAEDLYLMLGYSLLVPPHVREALFTRTFDNDDLIARIHTPVLVVHGAQDAIVKPSIVDLQMACVPHAQLRVMPNTGHAPFWDDAVTFNRSLRAFCQDL
jgi:pimeloyl-ACP methyl ester carboxylesterase